MGREPSRRLADRDQARGRTTGRCPKCGRPKCHHRTNDRGMRREDAAPLRVAQSTAATEREASAIERRSSRGRAAHAPTQRPSLDSSAPIGLDLDRRIRGAMDGGTTLPSAERRRAGAGLESAAARARVHDDATSRMLSRRVGAPAFTVDRHVFLDSERSGGVPGGRRALLAHELVHVAQSAVGPAPVVHRYEVPAHMDHSRWELSGRLREKSPELLQAAIAGAPQRMVDLAERISEAGVPTTDDERDRLDERLRHLVRLTAIGLMSSHRAGLAQKREAMTARLDADPTAELDEVRTLALLARVLASVGKDLDKSMRQLSSAANVVAEPSTDDWFEMIGEATSAYRGPKMRTYLQKLADGVSPRGDKEWKLAKWAIANSLHDMRKEQRDGITVATTELYRASPFLSELDLEGATDDKKKDDDLGKEVRVAFDKVLDDVDEAIVRIGSADIHPYDLPEAILGARIQLPPKLRPLLDREVRSHKTLEFWLGMGLGAAEIALIFVPVVGPWLAAGVGAASVASRAEGLLDKVALSEAGVAPGEKVLGTSGPGTLDWVLLAVEAALVAADIGMIVHGVRAGRAVGDVKAPEVAPARKAARAADDVVGEAGEVLIREYPGGGRLTRGADGKLRFCYNPCPELDFLRMEDEVIDRALSNYSAEHAIMDMTDVHGRPAETWLGDVIEFAASRNEVKTLSELMNMLAAGGDSSRTAALFLADVAKLRGANFSLQHMFDAFVAGAPVPSRAGFRVEMELRRLEAKVRKAVEIRTSSNKKVSAVKRAELDELDVMIKEEAEAVAGQSLSTAQLDRYRQDTGYATRVEDIETGKSTLQKLEDIGGGAEHTSKARGSTKNPHEAGRARKRAQEKRAVERLLER